MRILLILLCTLPAFPSLPPHILPVLLIHPASSNPQNSFSPFSILGSLFSSNPPWSRPPPTARQRKPQPQPQKIFFRPHLSAHQAGPTFSASQQVPQIVPFKSVRAPSPVRPSRGNLSPVNPTKIIRITSPSNFSSYPVVPVTPPASQAPNTRPSLSSIVSNTVDTALPSQHEQVEVVYPSNSVLPPEDVVTEQSIFSSFPSKDSHLSGPNHEEFPIVSLIDQPTGHNYYDEVFHNTVSSQPARQVPSRNVQPFYAAEEFNYNQDPIDLGLVHGTGPRVRDVLNSVSGSGPGWEPEDVREQDRQTTSQEEKDDPSLITTLASVSSLPAFSSSDTTFQSSFTLSPSPSSLPSPPSLPPSALPLISVPTSLSSSSPTFSTFSVSSTPSESFTTHSSSNSPTSHISSPSFSSSTSFSSSSSTSQSSSSSSPSSINFSLPQASSSSSPSHPVSTSFHTVPSTPSSSSFYTLPSSPSNPSFSSSLPSPSSPSSPSHPSLPPTPTSSSSPSSPITRTEKPAPRGKTPKSSTFSSKSPTFSSKSPTFSSQSPTFSSQSPTFSSQSPTFSSQSQSPTFSSQSPTFSPPQSPTFSTPESPTFSPQTPTFSPDFDEEELTTDPRHERLVNTIEYRATDYLVEERDDSSVTHNSSLADLGSLVDCGSGREVGWCPVSASYPTHRVEEMVAGCGQVLEAYRAVISQDLDLLGDNSPSIISSEKDHSRPWSWKVYAYKKKQVCASELYFMRPALARDSEGSWQVILQTPAQSQVVAVDMCHSPDSACPGLQDCGKKSRCVQRYNYQLLLSLPSSSSSSSSSSSPAVSCPSLRAFRFPSGCVCHAETTGE